MQPQVLIVGAGPTGLVLALTLLKSGIPVRIIEKEQTHHVSSRGSGVQARIQEIEYVLDTLPDIQAVGMPPPPVILYDPKNPAQVKRTANIMEPVDPTPQFPITAALMVNQYLHEEVLRSHVKAHGGTIEMGTELSTLEQHNDNVTVHLTKVIDGKQIEETALFPYVVGADGGHSVVRKLLGLQFLGETHEQEKILNADVDLKGLEGYGMHSFSVDPSLVVVFRSTNTPERFQILITGHACAEISRECMDAGPEEFQAIIRRLTNRPDLEIPKVHTKYEWKYNTRVVDHFRKGRIFVAGDAAHTHSPMGGQGMTSSIQDAFNLAWKLALVVRGHASPILLDSYEEERSPCIADVLLESARLHRLAYGEKKGDTNGFKDEKYRIQKTIDALGNAAAPLSAASDSLGTGKKTNEKELESRLYRGRKLFQLDLNYRWSPIVFDERFLQSEADSTFSQKDAYGKVGHDLRAGDRAPDAPGLVVLRNGTSSGKVAGKQGEIVRLFDVFDPTLHMVVVFSSNPKKLSQGLARTLVILPQGSTSVSNDVDADLILTDNEGHAYQGYGVGEGTDTVVVVRPDAMIGAFTTTTRGLEQYFTKLFSLA